MPRPLWNGSLSFGLVNVPVQLTGATRDLDLHFRQLHKKDGAPIEQRRFCSQDDVEVEWEEVGRGFALRGDPSGATPRGDDGKQVVLTDEELASVQPDKTRTIDVQAFVDLEDVDPIYFDNTWFLVPAGDSQGTRRAYRLLVEVMESTERAALGRFVMRTKEYLVLVRPREGLLSLTTMRFHDEVRPTDGIVPGGRKPAKEKIEQAVAVIESLGTDWDPERYTDCYRQRLQKVVEQKKKGQKVKAPSEPKEPKPAPDLMEALQATLERMGSSKGKGNGKGSRKKDAAKA
jgi:DNA end-binding protein Ku